MLTNQFLLHSYFLVAHFLGAHAVPAPDRYEGLPKSFSIRIGEVEEINATLTGTVAVRLPNFYTHCQITDSI